MACQINKRKLLSDMLSTIGFSKMASEVLNEPDEQLGRYAEFLLDQFNRHCPGRSDEVSTRFIQLGLILKN